MLKQYKVLLSYKDRVKCYGNVGKPDTNQKEVAHPDLQILMKSGCQRLCFQFFQ